MLSSQKASVQAILDTVSFLCITHTSLELFHRVRTRLCEKSLCALSSTPDDFSITLATAASVRTSMTLCVPILFNGATFAGAFPIFVCVHARVCAFLLITANSNNKAINWCMVHEL
jgi:hypothetical protein